MTSSRLLNLVWARRLYILRPRPNHVRQLQSRHPDLLRQHDLDPLLLFRAIQAELAHASLRERGWADSLAESLARSTSSSASSSPHPGICLSTECLGPLYPLHNLRLSWSLTPSPFRELLRRLGVRLLSTP